MSNKHGRGGDFDIGVLQLKVSGNDIVWLEPGAKHMFAASQILMGIQCGELQPKLSGNYFLILGKH
jgi:hypothetical protein